MLDLETLSSLWWAHGIQRKPMILSWCVLSGTSQFSREFLPFFFFSPTMESYHQAAVSISNYVMHKRSMQ